MTLLAESAGRWLEPDGNVGPRRMTVIAPQGAVTEPGLQAGFAFIRSNPGTPVPGQRFRRASRRISRAAFMPGTPVTPPPGCAPAPHRYSPATGIR